MGYISRGNDRGDAGEITLSEETLIAQIAVLGTPLYHLRVNAAGTGLEYAADSVGITGTLTPNTIPKATGAGTIGDSSVTDDGTTVSTTENLQTTKKFAVGASGVIGGSDGNVIIDVADTVNLGNFAQNTKALSFIVNMNGVGGTTTGTALFGEAKYTGTTAGIGPIMKANQMTLTQGATVTWFGPSMVYVGNVKTVTGGTGGMGIVSVYNSAVALADFAATGRPTELNHFRVTAVANNAGSKNGIASSVARGFLIEEVTGKGASGTATPTAIGIQINGQTRGTANIGMWMNGDAIGADILFGTASSAQMYYDGTNLIINPKLAGSGALSILGNVSLLDYNVALGTTTGTKIGTGTTQKLGFWNAAPIVQPTIGIAASTFVANTSGIVNDTATWDGYTIGQVVKALRNSGLLA